MFSRFITKRGLFSRSCVERTLQFSTQSEHGADMTTRLNSIRFDACSPATLLKVSNQHGKFFKSSDVGSWWSQLAKQVAKRGPNEVSVENLHKPRNILLSKIPKLLNRDIANVSAALVKLQPMLSSSKMNSDSNEEWTKVWDSLTQRAIKTQSHFNPAAISTMLWAYAKNQNYEPDLFSAFEEKMLQTSLSQFSSQSLSNIAWAYTVTGNGSMKLYEALEQEVLKEGRLKDFAPQGITNLAWSFAKVSYGSDLLFENIARETINRGLKDFSVQGIANLAWAFGKRKPHLNLTIDLLDAISLDARGRNPKNFSPQAVSNIAWALAAAQHPNASMFELVDGLVMKYGLEPFNPQEVSNIVWAFAKTQTSPSSYFFECLEKDMLHHRDMSVYNEEELMSLMWALGGFEGHVHPAVALRILDEMVSRGLSCFETRGIANTIHAIAKLGLCEHEFFNCILNDFKVRKHEYTTLDIAEMMVGLSYISHEDPELFRTIIEHLKSQPANSFNCKYMSMLMWSFAVLDIDVEPFFGVEGWMSRCSNTEWSDVDLVQLHQWQLSSSYGLPDELSIKCHAVMSSLTNVNISAFQVEVGETLSSIQGITIQSEVVLPKLGYSVDFLVDVDLSVKGEQVVKQVVIEVDGPGHFLLDSDIPTGPTLLKRRHLQSYGHKLVSIPSWEWAALDDSFEERAEYLSNAISIVLSE